MDIGKIIVNLQELIDSSLNTFDQLVLAKSIEKLKVGAVQSVSAYSDLPVLPLDSDGSLFIVVEDEELYYNVGSTWERFRPPDFYAMSWGLGTSGQLGDGTVIARSSPVTVVGGITNWSQISAGGLHSLGITEEGILYAWGSNIGTSSQAAGQLGDGTVIARSSPVTVVGGITNWSAISAGAGFSLGVTETGIAYAWGYNSATFGSFRGMLGDDTTINRSSPVTVVGGITNWNAVSAGSFHSLGLTDTGVLYAWGVGTDGQLGDGTVIARSSPVTVVGGITNWSAISAGAGFSLGVTDTGILYAWGVGTNGRLGDGTVIARSSPVTVVGGITNWSAISAGRFHSLGLTDTGVPYAWGYNQLGRLGDGTTINHSSPVTVVGGITNWSEISAGDTHSLGLTSTGIAYAWGGGGNGVLGDETIIGKSSPITVVGGITNWSAVSAGGSHSLAIKTN
jgi:alpha-tubulin suppressor-like RCC1 family protein